MKQYKKAIVLLLLLSIVLTACQSAPDSTTPTAASVANVPEEPTAVPTEYIPPPTWTAVPAQEEPTAKPTEPPPPTSTPQPTSTPIPIPTNTPIPTDTPTPTATATNTPAPTSPPQPTSPPVAPPPSQPDPNTPLGQDILPNGDFESGHYNQNGIPELQLPNGWRLEYDEGPTGLGTESWDQWVRPEARVLSNVFLPPSEHPLFIYDGVHTIKIFKGFGAISFRLVTDVTIEAGTYQMTINVYPDLYTDFANGQKVWANPGAGLISFVVRGGSGGTGWIEPAYGRKNTLTHTFTVPTAQTITIGVAIQGPYAIGNNGWFMDDWSLQKVQ